MKLHTPHYPENKSLPAFSIYRNKVRIPSIEESFMEKAFLNIQHALDGYDNRDLYYQFRHGLIEKHGKTYERVYDNVELPDDPTILEIPIIISFQRHAYGNFAVIRNEMRNQLSVAEYEKYATIRYEGDPAQLKPVFSKHGTAVIHVESEVLYNDGDSFK